MKTRVQLPQPKLQHPNKECRYHSRKPEPTDRDRHSLQPKHHAASLLHDWNNQSQQSVWTPANDSIIQGAGAALAGQFTTNTTNATGCNKAWRNNNRGNAPTYTFPLHTTRTTGRNGFFSNSLNSSNNRNAPTYFRFGELGCMRHECVTEGVFCNYCKSNSHSNRACRKLTTPSPTNSHIPTGYDPTATPPPLTGNAPNPGKHTTAQPQPMSTTNNGLWFQNYQDTNQPRTSTTVHMPPMNNMSPASWQPAWQKQSHSF